MIEGAARRERLGALSVGQALLVGLAAVTGANLLAWRRDRELADRLRASAGAPPYLSRHPKVSVLVAAWNEEDRIDAHVRSFLAMSYRESELILCAGGKDLTLELARRYDGERVTVLEQRAGEGKQRALARCLEHASGEVIYLTDADCLYSDDALTRLLGPLVNEGEQAATGGSRPLPEQEGQALAYYLWGADAVSSARAPAYTGGLLGRNAAVTREALARIGGLDFDARTGTDYQLARRLIGAGTNIRHVSESVVASEYPRTLGEYRRKQSRWLRNLLLHGSRFGARDDVLATARTVGLGAAMLATPALGALFARWLLVPWALLVGHAIGSKLRHAFFASRLFGRPVPRRLRRGGAAGARRLRRLGAGGGRPGDLSEAESMVGEDVRREAVEVTRVALIAKPGGPNTGVGRYVHELERGLAEAGVAVERVGPTPPPLPGFVCWALRKLGLDLRAFLTTYPVWASYPAADVYHLASQNLATLLLFHRPRGRVVVTVHDIIPYLLRDDPKLSAYRTLADRLFDRLAMAGLRRADCLIADSEYTKRCVVGELGVAPERIPVVYLGVDHERFRPLEVRAEIRERYGLPPGRRYLIYVGSEDPRKNLPTLWRALAAVRREMPDVELIKVGLAHFGRERWRLVDLGRELGILEAVHFLDDVSEADLPLLYNLADACVMPSLHEGFGLPVLEAMACGTPVVAAEAASLPELVGEAGLTFPVGTDGAERLAEGIRRILTGVRARGELEHAGSTGLSVSVGRIRPGRRIRSMTG